MGISIIWQDEHYIAVDKPINLAVHKNKFMPNDAPYLTKIVGGILDQWVYNVHRLDAKTSGVIVIAKSSEAASKLTKCFEKQTVSKTYQAIVKGMPGSGVFDNPVLDRKKGKRVRAETHFDTLEEFSTAISYKAFENVSLSRVALKPKTGRWHQLRQHCAQQRFDIIGDVQHGDWTLNRIVTELTGIERLLLHAEKLVFQHPYSEETIELKADLPADFQQIFQQSLVHKQV